MNTAIALSVPVQVGVETVFEPQDFDLPTFESAVAEEEADSYFQPRAMHGSALQNDNRLPGYSELSRRTVSVA
jgi:hypothetical protein